MNTAKKIWWYSGNGYGADVNAYVAKLNADGVTKPSGTVLSAMDVMMKALRAAFPTELDTTNIYGFGSLEAGKYNIEDVETHEHTFPAGDPTYTEGEGVASDGVGTYVNTAYNTDQFANIETLLTVIIYISESSTDFSTTKTAVGARISSASNINTRIDPLTTASVGSRQGYGAADTFANADMKGLYILTYDGTNCVLYKDYDGLGGGIKDVQVLTPTAPNISNPVFLLARNGNTSGGSTPGNYFAHKVAWLQRVRKQLTDSDAATIFNIWNAFKGSVGLASFVVAGGTFNFDGVWSFSGIWNF